MSLCETCQQPATVHLSTIVHSVSLTCHFCPTCAESATPPDGNALFKAAQGVRCQYCGADATVSGMDQWAEVLGEQRLRSVCSRCGEEFDRYFEAALDAFGQDIPEAELPNVVRKLSTR